MSVVSVFLIVLLVAGIVLVWEARTGRLTPRTQAGATFRAALFLAATIAGGALLVRSAPSSMLLAVAMVPVTGLSLVRFVAVLRPTVGRGPLRTVFSTSLVLATLIVGVWVSLSMLPQELDQRSFIEQIFQRDVPSDARSIDPAARRLGRA